VQKLTSAKRHESAAKVSILFFYTNVYGGLNFKK